MTHPTFQSFLRMFFVSFVALLFLPSSLSAAAIDTLKQGEWYMFPSSNVSAVDPCPARNCNYSGVEGQQAVMDDWSGGAYDTLRDRLIVWGGGHNGYGGNEVYAFNTTTGTWSRLTEPSNPTSQCTAFYPDGRPASSHAYSFLQYVPTLDSFVTFGLGSFCLAGSGHTAYTRALNLSTNNWSALADSPGYGIGSMTAQDSGTGYVWMKGTGYDPSYDIATALYGYNPSTNTWTKGDNGNSDLAFEYDMSMAIDPIRHKLVAVGNGKFIVWDISNPLNVTRQSVTSTGATSILNTRNPGFVYDSTNNQFVAWNGGTTVYTLNPTTWVWTAVNPAPTNTITPTSANSRGTYGRFRYIPSKNAFIVVSRTTENVYAYKLPSGGGSGGGGGTTPTVSLSASPTSVTSGSSATLTWTSTNATSCTASGAWSGTKGTSGSQSTGPLTATATYTLTCGSAVQGVTVSVSSTPTPAPTVTFSATPTSITSGSSTTLTWSSTNTTFCTASGSGWSGTVGTASSVSLSPTITSTYSITCTGSGGTTPLQTATVTVTAPTPTPTPTGAITTVQLQNTTTSTQTSAVSTFGHAFKQGDVPTGNTVIAKDAIGNPITLQVDKKATHADGSLRHAILTAKLPTLAGSATQTITLSAQADGAVPTPVSLTNLLATTFDSQVSLNVGGTVYTASAKNLLQTTTPKQWLSGPEVSEWIVGGPVKTSTGVAHPHLTAYFHVRAYSGSPVTKVRVDAVVENNWTFRAGATAFTYIPTVTVGGATIYNNGGANLTQYHHTRWHQVGWWGSNPQIYAQPNTQYLRDTKAVPNYANLTLQSTVLGSYAQTIAPMSNANLRASWGDTGYSPQIGILPEWDASFVVSGGDKRAFNATLANSSAGGSYSYHYRDETTGYPVSIDTHPNMTEQDYSDGLVAGTGGEAYSHEPGADPAAHQPMLGYLAYLLSGDYFYLEEMQFLANYNMIWNSTGRRTYLSGPQDGIVGYQNRGQAWGIRTLGFAAAMTPDNHPLKNYLVNKTNNNIAEKTGNWAAPSKNNIGAIQDFDWISGYSVPPKYSPWQNDFFVIVFNSLVDLGFNNATTMRNWLNQWPVGRLGGNTGTSGYCPTYATQYSYSAGIVDATGAYVPNFGQLYQRNFPTQSASACPTSGLMTSGSYSNEATGYYSNMQPALAMAVDAGAATQSLWDKFVTMGTPDYTSAPVWAIVPRGGTPTPPPTGGGGTPAPTLTFSATPTSVTSGGSTTLTWSSTNTTFCTASGSGWSGTVGTASSVSLSPTTTSTYSITCTGSGGTTPLQSATVTVGSSTPPPTGGSLPAPWTLTDIGAPTPAGSATFASNIFTVTVGGPDIWGNSDNFTFINQPITGDAEIIARVESLVNTASWAKAGVMIRDSLTSGSTHAMLVVTPTNGISFQRRTAQDGISTSVDLLTAGMAPRYLRLTRAGNVLTSYYGDSATGPWTLAGSITITMTGTDYIGLAVTSNNAGTATTAVISNVTIPGAVVTPAPTLTLTTSPTTVSSGSASTLTWSSTNATSCSLSGVPSVTGISGTATISNITSTGTYTMTCTGAGGSVSQSVTITVTVPVVPPTVTLSSSASTVTSGGSSALTWSSTGATSCTASGAWSGNAAFSGTQTLSNLTATGTYTLTCTNSAGSVSQSVTITVTAATPVPTVTISATPASVTSGSPITLTWSSTNATTCTASNGWTGTKAISGTQAFNPTTTTTYTVTCTGAGGSSAQSTTVTVTALPLPTVTLTSPQTTITSGSNASLSWTATGATSCTASDAWSGTKAITGGTQTLTALTATGTYTLTCTNSTGSVNRSVTITVTAPTPAPTVSLTSPQTTITSGSNASLAWSSTNATSCTASGAWSGAKAITGGTQTLTALTATGTYTLTCTNATGSVNQSVTITVTAVVPSTPTVTLSATPSSVTSGGSSTLTWSSTNATSCTATGGTSGWSGAKAASGTQTFTSLSADTTYTMTCTGAGGTTAPQSTTVVVTAPPTVATVSFTAPLTSITTGDDATITWSSTGATSCTATNGWTGTKAISGTQTFTGLTTNTTYTLICNGGSVTPATQSITIAVTEAPVTPVATVTISANPSAITTGGSTVLTWSSTNASSCTASGSWAGTKGLSGTETISSIGSAASFTLTCDTATQSTSVAVASPAPAPSGGGSSGGGSSGGGGSAPAPVIITPPSTQSNVVTVTSSVPATAQPTTIVIPPTPTFTQGAGGAPVPGCTGTNRFSPQTGQLCPAVTPTFIPVFTKELKVGDKGPLVTTLQNLLISEKLLYAAPTGYFGPATKLALTKFQEKYRSETFGGGQATGDGTFATSTRAKANTILAEKAITTKFTTPGTTTAGTTTGTTFKRSLFVGSRGPDVMALQQVLAQEGLFTATPTQYFGPLTLKALKLFQVKYNISGPNLPGYGNLGPKTRGVLNGR